ncbi:MAG: phosphatidylglycerophosphatase A [Phycisphaerales bacterium]|nr:phosphatidylglycerophosphatase A [Phycisphaerales bacterium]
MMTRIKDLIVTAGGLGHCRPASGTWGSTPPVIVWIILVLAGVQSRSMTMMVVMLVIAAAFSIGCVALGRWAEKRYGKKDPGQVVADEVAGQAVALLFLPTLSLGFGPDWLSMIAPGVIAFLAFRMFDIIKPPPANQLQKLSAGWGILIDDIFAGVYANIGTQLGIIFLAQPILERLT